MSRASATGLVAVVIAGLTALTGCGGDESSAVVEAGAVRAWTVADSGGTTDVGVSGIVRWLPDARCFVLRPDDPGPGDDVEALQHPVLWPQGTTIASTEPVALAVPGHGSVSDGDEVQGGGFYGSPPDDVEIPAACFGAGGDVAYMER